MVSLVGSKQYQETSLDGEYFQPNHEKIFHCYKHIIGATLVTCDYSNYDEYLFGKHREWFCKFRNGRCLQKCQNCEEIQRKCLETEDCRQLDNDLDKKEKKKTLFSMFSKKENKDDEINQEETAEIVDDNKSHQTEQSEDIKEEPTEKKPAKKSFFSIFGHDEEDLKNTNKTVQEKPENESQDVSSIGTQDDNLTTEADKPQKKKSLFSKFSKKDSTKGEEHETKWHDESSDEEIEDKKIKKKSFFSRLSKKDLTKNSDSENEGQEPNNMDETELLDEKQEDTEEDKKKKKKSFFSRFSKKDLTKDTDSEHEEEVQKTVEQVEIHENKSEEEPGDKNNKKKLLVKVSKSNKSEEISDNEESLQEFLDSSINDEHINENETKKKEKKKSIFSRSPKKEKDKDLSKEENQLHDAENNKKKDKKKSVFSRSSKKEDEEEKDSENEDNASENQLDKSENDNKKEKKRNIFSLFSKKAHKDENELKNEETDNETIDDQIKNNEDDKNLVPEEITVEDNIISEITDNLQTENHEEIAEDDNKKPKRERRKSFLAIFSKKDEADLNDSKADEESNSHIEDEAIEDKNLKKKDKKKAEKEDTNEENTGTKLTRRRSFLSKSKLDLTKDKDKQKHDEFENFKIKSFENCEVCFTKFKNCINNCYNCYTRIEEYNWFDHSVLRHAIKMNAREYEDNTIACYLNAEFNKKMHFYFLAYNYCFFFDFIFSSGSIIINMVSNMNGYACQYFKCHYTVSWLDTDFTEELRFEGKEFWDWNVHTILTDKAVDDKFFDKCKLVIKIAKM